MFVTKPLTVATDKMSSFVINRRKKLSFGTSGEFINDVALISLFSPRTPQFVCESLELDVLTHLKGESLLDFWFNQWCDFEACL